MNNNTNSELFSLFHDFYAVTGIVSGIWDINYQSINRINEEDICRYLHKSNREITNECSKCDLRATRRCRELRCGFLYRCHMGFWEYITPIFRNEDIIGFASTGVMSDGSAEEYEILVKNIEKFGVDIDEFKAQYEETKHHSMEEIRSICTLFETCISHIYRWNLIQITDIGLFQNIDQFITQNIRNPLNVPILCKEFGISKTDLYRVFSRYTDLGIAEYIKSKRLDIARNLIEDSRKNITEIADHVGYSDYSYFTKVFTAKYGTGPREYRKQLKNKKS